MRNAGLGESQAGIKIARRNIFNLRYADDTTLMAESEEELKILLMRVKEEWKGWLKTQHSKNKDHAIWSHNLMANRRGKMETVTDFIFLGSKIIVDGDCSHEIQTLAPWKKNYEKPRQRINNKRHHFANKGPYSQSYSFFSNHVWMWELDHKEGWAPKFWCLQIVMLKTLESPLDCKEIKPVNSNGNQPCIFIGRTDTKAEAPVLWPPDGKSQPTHWKRLWFWEMLKTKGEGGGREWHG